MLKNTQNQMGSAHIIITVVLVIAIVGALGFVAWKNFFVPKNDQTIAQTEQTADSKDTSTESVKTENSKYSNSKLSFEYLPSWSESDVIEDTDEIVRLNSEDHKPSIGMGLDAGAELTVSLTNQQEVPTFPGIKDVQEIKVDGYKGFRYSIEYEGYRLQAFFNVPGSSGDTNYAITMQTADLATTEQLEVFNLVLSTFDVK